MSSVKWNLLNCHFWSCILDVSLSILATPYLLFPKFAGCPLGLFKETGISTILHILYVAVLIGVLTVSMIHIFEARFLIFIDDDHWWLKMRMPCFILNYLIAFCYIIPVYYSMPEQAEA
ncbi:Protein CBG01342 [Caenorhabditis briggsae]|uniref:Protein CBG01342 n=1 Tax=Caenorhabditis briggsae TaxID=6238 RepID=A8WQ67_CAEBR|nr:Protein CBG01342 [Caenorhabditis briggsae]CAP22625.2 Protein CBG01342 [Caenorhabditis briggsae]